MIKKKIALIITLAMAASLASGCRNSTNTPSSNPESPAQASESEMAVDETQPEEADEESGISVDHILMAIEAAYGDEYPPNGEIPAEQLEEVFGLTADMYVDAKGVTPMISTFNDRVVVVQAAPGKEEEVAAALEETRRRMIGDTMQYPMNIPKTNAAKVVSNGDFVAFLLVGRLDDSIEDAESAEAKQHAEDEVQIAVDAFNSVFAE